MKIGERIRRQRKKMGYSLRELGARAGLSAGSLSQIENDQISPSLNSLQSIATALEVPMFYFLDNTQPDTIIRANERRRLYFPDSHISYEILSPSASRQMVPYLIRMEPGCTRIARRLFRPTEQWMFVLQGILEITVSEKTSRLEKGDGIYFDGDLLREFASVGDEELQMIFCITPPAL